MRQDSSLPSHIHRHLHIPALLLEEPSGLYDSLILAVNGCPCAFGQIELYPAVLVENRCHEDLAAKYVLFVQEGADGVVLEFEDHGAHDGEAVILGLLAGNIYIRHE